MEIVFYISLFITAFVLMELTAWFTHKYIMHGFLWRLHKDHHVNKKGGLEHNDWFSLIFALPSFLLIYCGLKYGHTAVTVTGFAMAAYGAAYFLVHDVFIHQRITLFRNAGGAYLQALRRSHRSHHRNTRRENGESFGFLIVGKKHFRQEDHSLFDKKG
jgi:beta-carotene 3-hydroxylase